MDKRDNAVKERLIEKILAVEWEMFQAANGAGPKASCQLDGARFRGTRACQYNAWSAEHLQSWLEDLEGAESQGRNLAAEKYMRMMEDTYPEEFSAIRPWLPDVEAESRALADEITAIHTRWRKELENLFPALMNRGRPASGSPGAQGAGASFETYLRCELLTCSAKTLTVYKRDIERMLAEGASEARLNLLNQVRDAGFGSLESAEEYFAKR